MSCENLHFCHSERGRTPESEGSLHSVTLEAALPNLRPMTFRNVSAPSAAPDFTFYRSFIYPVSPMSTNPTPLVGILMGSKNDLEIMSGAAEVFKELGIPYEVRALSAHRTPDQTLNTPPRLKAVASKS